MKPPKRGRPPIGRKAMTDAQRQAKRRAKQRQEAKLAKELRDGRPLPISRRMATRRRNNPANSRATTLSVRAVTPASRKASSSTGLLSPATRSSRWPTCRKTSASSFWISSVSHASSSPWMPVLSYMERMRVCLDEVCAGGSAVTPISPTGPQPPSGFVSARSARSASSDYFGPPALKSSVGRPRVAVKRHPGGDGQWLDGRSNPACPSDRQTCSSSASRPAASAPLWTSGPTLDDPRDWRGSEPGHSISAATATELARPPRWGRSTGSQGC